MYSNRRARREGVCLHFIYFKYFKTIKNSREIYVARIENGGILQPFP